MYAEQLSKNLVIINSVNIFDSESDRKQRPAYFIIAVRGFMVRIPVAVRMKKVRCGNDYFSSVFQKSIEPAEYGNSLAELKVFYHLRKYDHVERLRNIIQTVVIVRLFPVYIHRLICCRGDFRNYLFAEISV